MAEMTAYAPGTPNWVDATSPNLDASVAFYRELFGWEAVDAAAGGGDAGGYQMFQLRGRFVAGIGPVQDDGAPPSWSTYIASPDAWDTADAISAAGGTVVMDPFPIADAGRMLVATDPAGATFSVWEAGEHAGAGLVNEPGAFAWSELNTRDPEAAFAFYAEVFGWQARTTEMGGGGSYTEFLLDGRSVAGGIDMRGRVPDDIPAHWLTYFAVDDTDAAVARVEELGGQVMVPATDIDPGRFAVVADEAGAFFAVIALAGGRN